MNFPCLISELMICWSVHQAWNISQLVSENLDHLPVNHRSFRYRSWVQYVLSITGCALWLTVFWGIWVSMIFQEGCKSLKKEKKVCRPRDSSLPSTVSVMAWFSVFREVTSITFFKNSSWYSHLFSKRPYDKTWCFTMVPLWVISTSLLCSELYPPTADFTPH